MRTNGSKAGLWWALALIGSNVLTNLGGQVLTHYGITAPIEKQASRNEATQQTCCIIANKLTDACLEREDGD